MIFDGRFFLILTLDKKYILETLENPVVSNMIYLNIIPHLSLR